MCSSWLPQHDVLRTFRYSWWSQIGVDTEKEMAELCAPFNTKYPWHMPTPEFLADRAVLQARLACSYAIVSICEHIQDTEFLAARADINAVLELMTNAFVHAWGPRFSPCTRVRCPRRLARQAQEELEAAQAVAATATAAALMDIMDIDNDTDASTWGNSGWGDGSGWSNGSGWGSGLWGRWGAGTLSPNATTVQGQRMGYSFRRPMTAAQSTSLSAGEASVATIRKTESVWEELARAGGSGRSGPYGATSPDPPESQITAEAPSLLKHSRCLPYPRCPPSATKPARPTVLPHPAGGPSYVSSRTLCRTLKSKDQVPLPISGVVHLVQCYGVLMPSRGHPFKPAAVYNVPVAMFACNAPPVPPMPKIVHRSPKPVTPKVAVTSPTSASDSILAFDNEEAVGVEAQLCQAQRLECWTRSPLLPRPTHPKHARMI
ncbi:hypothetical protein DFH08DRAFT_802377 [Mycena albidolilacea]|uniref:Uncharacterized protein n=1 Tax=Mycena albidolilacea TaxID=1033008 RepID=A0AAD7AH68_9AGAR|nr:hypothetical protein DFH08DRAFT_802377 [Mycena albidolilacea]